MIPKAISLIVAGILLSLFLCETVFSTELTKPENVYRHVLVLENKEVFGVSNQKTANGKSIPIKLAGEEKVKVLLYKFTMKDDVSIEMLRTDKTHQLIVDILTIEKKCSEKLLREWLKSENSDNRDKAAYLLDLLSK